MQPVLVEIRRGPLVECVHEVDVAIVRGDDTVVGAGDPDRIVYLRSSAKLVQALACVLTGAADRFDFTPAELALAAASHNGEPLHVETARSMLRKAGLSERHLRCGAHAPIHGPSRDALAASGASATAIHNNCSGKHAAMLAACVAAGWPVEDYLEPDHPLQRLNLDNVAAFTGVAAEDIVSGVDGCSAPVFAVPLRCGARMFRVVGRPDTADGLSPEQREAAVRIRDAVADHPTHLAGTDREDTDVIAATHGRVLCKVGAEGKWCLAVRDARVGVAVACRDGARRAATAVGLEVLRGLGALDDGQFATLGRHTGARILNHRGRIVGTTTVVPPRGLVPA